MKTRRHIGSLTAIAVSLLTLTCSAGSYKHITIDGDFSDWAGVPVAYTQPADTTLIPLKNPPSLFESFGRRGRLQAD
jgi:hypothetical protein